MMRYFLTFLLFIIYANIHIPCCSQNVFNNVYGIGDLWYDAALEVIQTNDGEFLAVGSSSFNDINDIDDIYIVKIRTNGDTVWSKYYDLSLGGSEGAFGIAKTGNNFAITGRLFDTLRKEDDMYLLKIDSLGKIIWFKTLDVGYSDKGTEIKLAPQEDGFLITGYIYDDSTFNSSTAFLVKTDTGGNVLWQQNYGDTGYDFTYSISFTSEGGYLLGRETSPYASTLNDLMLIKTDSLGNLIWRKIYGGSMREGQGYALVDKEGNYVIAGKTQLTTDDYQGYIIKTDTSGKIIWEKQFGTGYDYDRFIMVKETMDGNYIAGGATSEYSYAPQIFPPRCWLVKINPQGDSIWARIYTKYGEKNTDDYLNDIEIADDGGFLICGYVINNALPGKNDAWLVKTDSCGYTVGNSPQPQAQFSIDSASGMSVYLKNTTVNGCWYKWHLGDGDTVMALNASHTYADTGTYIVTLYAYAGDKSDAVSDTVKIYKTGRMEIISPEPANDFQVFVDAHHSIIHIANNHYEKYQNQNVQFEMMDITGRKLKILPIRKNNISIENKNLSSGIYFYQITVNSERVKAGKVIIY